MADELILQLDDKKDDLYTQIIKTNINDRRIVINYDISDTVIEDVVLWILQWNKQDKGLKPELRKKIYLYVSSDGGDCVVGSFLLSIMNNSITPIVTVGLSKCASMASYILANGHERLCFDNTIVLIHDGQTGYMASGNKGKDIQKFYDNLDANMQNNMINHTKMTKEYLDSIKDREMYIFGQEAKEKGIVDKIIGVDCDLDYIL